MSMTYEDAWQEEAYDQMAREILESHREEIIDEFVAERMKSYYQDNPDLTIATETVLNEAKYLLNVSPTASLVFSRSAIDLALREVLLKPIAFGMVHDANTASLMVELAVGNQQFSKLLFRVLQDYGVDLRTVVRDTGSNTLWAEIKEIANIRNQILHRGQTASKEQAERSLKIASILLYKLYPYLKKQLMTQ